MARWAGGYLPRSLVPPGWRVCSKCWWTLTLDEFGPCRTARDGSGLHHRCIRCRKEHTKEERKHWPSTVLRLILSPAERVQVWKHQGQRCEVCTKQIEESELNDRRKVPAFLYDGIRFVAHLVCGLRVGCDRRHVRIAKGSVRKVEQLTAVGAEGSRERDEELVRVSGGG